MRIANVYSAYNLAVLYFIVFLLINIETPLGWQEKLGIDGRYNNVFYVYITVFVGTYYLLSKLIGIKRRDHQLLGQNYMRHTYIYEHRLMFMLVVSILFVFLTFYKLEAIPIFAQNKHELRGAETLGGFVDYQIDLITMLSIIYLYLYKLKQKKYYLIMSLVALMFPILLQNRQELVIYLLMYIYIMHREKNIGIGSIMMLSILLISIVYGLGAWFLIRRGVENVYTGEFSYLLPFWVFLGDFVSGVWLGYKVVDVAGPGGLNYMYTVPVYLSVIMPNIENIIGDHGAVLIQKEYTKAETAQSIGIPLSYYADGGMTYVIMLAVLNSSILLFLKYRSNSSTRGLQYDILYGMVFIWSIWIIRSGYLSVGPILLYQALALFTVVRGKYAGVSYLIYLSVILLAMVVGITRLQ